MCVGLSLGRSTPRIRGMDRSPRSALTLLVTRVLADHQQFAVPADQLALLANTLDAGSHLHRRTLPVGRRSRVCGNYYPSTPPRSRQGHFVTNTPSRQPNPPRPLPYQGRGSQTLLLPLPSQG